MATINVSAQKKKKKTTDPSMGLDKEKLTKESINIGQNLGLAILSLVIAAGTYFFTKSVLVPDIAIWAREILSLILSLLVLAGFSAVSKGKSKIGGSVVTFLFAIFIWQIVSAYSDYDFSQDDDERGSCTSSTEARVRTLYPREEPYVFHLAEVGDETELFKAPTGIKYSIFYSSHNFGYELIYNDGTVYHGDPNNPVPKKRHAVIKIRATKPNQFVNVRLVER